MSNNVLCGMVKRTLTYTVEMQFQILIHPETAMTLGRSFNLADLQFSKVKNSGRDVMEIKQTINSVRKRLIFVLFSTFYHPS